MKESNKRLGVYLLIAAGALVLLAALILLNQVAPILPDDTTGPAIQGNLDGTSIPDHTGGTESPEYTGAPDESSESTWPSEPNTSEPDEPSEPNTSEPDEPSEPNEDIKPDKLNLATMQIVLPKDSTDVEKSAATELQTYIQKMTGSAPVVTCEGENNGYGIYIGATQYAKNKGITYPTDGDTYGEAWAIQEVDGNLVLCGAERRGTLYAVYHLLEDVLGVRWWNLWEEYVPTGDAIVPAGYKNSGVPVMEYRDVYIGGYLSVNDYSFFVRNRVNGNLIISYPANFGGTEKYGSPAHTHTFSRYFSSNADFASHPEWFALDESGERIPDGQLCLSNAGLREEFAKRLIDAIENDKKSADAAGRPYPNYYAIVPNDYERFCQCDACQKTITEKGYAYYVLSLVNELADAVATAGHTDVVLEMLAYWHYMDPPEGITPRANVQIRFADNYTDLLHGLDHANNADTMERLEKWAELCNNNLYFWQYAVNYNNNGVFPSMFYYGDMFTTLSEMGVNGWFTELEQCINVDFWDMKLWLITKLMEKPVTGEEYSALMDEYIYGYYGEAGKYIRDYLYYMHDKAEETNADQNFGTHIIGAEWLTVEDILKGNEYFDKAYDAVFGDEVLMRRVRSARNGLDRVIVENYARWASEAKAKGLTLPFTKQEIGSRVYQTMQEQIALRGDYDVDYPMFFGRYDNYADERAPLPDELENISWDRILEYQADDFRLAYDYAVATDKDSLIGQAAKCQCKISSGIPIALYDPEAEDGSSGYVGQIQTADILANQGYQLYKFTWTVPQLSDSAATGAYFYILGDWGVQIPQAATDLWDYRGQTVEVWLSLKVEGDVSASNPADDPVVYIDRLFIVTQSQ